MREERHIELSELTDAENSVYELTREIAGIAKQIKEETKEEVDPVDSILESINILYKTRIQTAA